MKQFLTLLGATAMLLFGVQAIAQSEPQVVFTEEVETVVTVRGVHHVNRTVTVVA